MLYTFMHITTFPHVSARFEGVLNEMAASRKVLFPKQRATEKVFLFNNAVNCCAEVMRLFCALKETFPLSEMC